MPISQSGNGTILGPPSAQQLQLWQVYGVLMCLCSVDFCVIARCWVRCVLQQSQPLSGSRCSCSSALIGFHFSSCCVPTMPCVLCWSIYVASCVVVCMSPVLLHNMLPAVMHKLSGSGFCQWYCWSAQKGKQWSVMMLAWCLQWCDVMFEDLRVNFGTMKQGM